MTYKRPTSTRPVRATGDPAKVYKLRVHRTGQGIRRDAEPVRRHLHALLDLGLTPESIARAAGIGADAVAKVRDGQTLIDARTARALMSVSWRPNPRQAVCLAIGARRRVEALAALGWSTGWIAEQVGLLHSNLRPVIGKTRCSYRHWAAIRDLYETYSMRLGPSARTREHAERNGWVPPLGWDDDDIDDPAATSHHDLTGRQDYGVDPAAVERAIAGDRKVSLTRPERWAVVQELHAQGLSDGQIADRAGLVSRTVLRDRQSLGLAANENGSIHRLPTTCEAS